MSAVRVARHFSTTVRVRGFGATQGLGVVRRFSAANRRIIFSVEPVLTGDTVPPALGKISRLGGTTKVVP